MNLLADPIFVISLVLLGGSLIGVFAILYNECCMNPIEVLNEGNTAPNTPDSSMRNDILYPRDIEVGYLNESR